MVDIDRFIKSEIASRQILLNIGFHPCLFMEINNILRKTL